MFISQKKKETRLWIIITILCVGFFFLWYFFHENGRKKILLYQNKFLLAKNAAKKSIQNIRTIKRAIAQMTTEMGKEYEARKKLHYKKTKEERVFYITSE